ncbi:uncharacterized protein LOC112465177 [Temnothorax curvispinosus]|uniref:Uncharacterized protein LOC112465177 n=1 Tax=Temnothorax curvispinosus TaxID=300111 RepID=A0A6J1R2M7_9HYME|nr:uncharacterized protein LOC112465177 [Temnothorax curvispinosus]
MATKVCYVAILVALLASAHPGASAPDWMRELNEQISAMTRNIQRQTQELTQHVNSQIENSLRPALAEVDKAIANLPKDAQGRIITSGSVITNGGKITRYSYVNGKSQTIESGHTPDGEPYVRRIEEENDGKYLYHNEVSFNPRTNATDKIRWKLNLTTPGAIPEIITDEK